MLKIRRIHTQWSPLSVKHTTASPPKRLMMLLKQKLVIIQKKQKQNIIPTTFRKTQKQKMLKSNIYQVTLLVSIACTHKAGGQVRTYTDVNKQTDGWTERKGNSSGNHSGVSESDSF